MDRSCTDTVRDSYAGTQLLNRDEQTTMTTLNLTYELHDRLNPFSAELWTSFFSDHPDPAELIKLVEFSGLADFQFKSIVVRQNGEPVLLLPLFRTHYSLSTTLDDSAKRWAAALEKLMPSTFKPEVLGVGFIEGEWGQIGTNKRFSPEIITRALSGALDYLDSVAKLLKVQIIAFKDFTDATGSLLPAKIGEHYSRATSLPFCQIQLSEFSDFGQYLCSLPRKVRQDLNRKIRQSSEVKVVHSTEPSPWIDRIYELYVEQVGRSDMSLGIHNREYFAEVCQRVDGAFYILFFHDQELIGFNLVIASKTLLLDKYVGMDVVRGRENNIYFLAWMEKIKHCIVNRIPLLHLGAAAEAVKVRLGASMVPSYIFFRHRNPIFNFAMSKLTPMLSYETSVNTSSDSSAD